MLSKNKIRNGGGWLARLSVALVVSLLVCLSGGKSQAQNPPFSSGSTGHEGALNITASGVTYFDPVLMNLNPVVPGIFNFTTINVASGSTLKFTENKYHGPVYFLASGDVTINGTLDLTGDNAYVAIDFTSQRVPNAAGSGGFSGGIGGFGAAAPLPGNGPGGGAAGTSSSIFGKRGNNTSNQFLVPIIGGSGGGGHFSSGSIGAAGGGGLLIASSTTIIIGGSGVITAVGGGFTCNNACGGGAGAGGAVRLVANTIGTTGSVSVGGGNPCCNNSASDGPGGTGLARFESNNLGGPSVSSGSQFRSTPFPLNLPTTPAASIKVTSINGQSINSNPFSFPDLTINAAAPVPITIQAQFVPVGTTAQIYVFSETGPDQVVTIGPLTAIGADPTQTTATVNITYPPGGSRGYVKAKW